MLVLYGIEWSASKRYCKARSTEKSINPASWPTNGWQGKKMLPDSSVILRKIQKGLNVNIPGFYPGKYEPPKKTEARRASIILPEFLIFFICGYQDIREMS